MELRQLHYFVALHEEGSVTRAARRLNVVQPAISMQIGKLEEELGQKLFERTPKGMVPTSAGNEAYHLFVPLLRELRLSKDQLASFGDRIAGHISAGVIASVSNNALSECLGSFCTKYPDVSIRVTGGYTADFLEMLQVGTLDLAVINLPRRRTALPAIPILREDLAVICAAGNPRRRPDAVTLETIAALKIVLPSRRHGLRTIIDDVAAEAGVKLSPQIEIDELKTIEEFVTGTDYFTIIPPIAVHRALHAGRLELTMITPPITREIVCVHSPKRGLSAPARLFIDALKEHMANALDLIGHTRFDQVSLR